MPVERYFGNLKVRVTLLGPISLGFHLSLCKETAGEEHGVSERDENSDKLRYFFKKIIIIVISPPNFS